MQIVYFSHSYRQDDQRVNDFFSRLMESEQLVLSLDPPSETVNAAKLQRHLNGNDGMVAVLTRRNGGISPYIGFEIALCLRSRKPLLVFVEDVLPDGLIPARVLQRRFSRGAFLRQVREHRHGLQVFKSYLGDDPPPRYQPEVSQRSCVFAGEQVLTDDLRESLINTVSQRGYRVVSSNTLGDDDTRRTEALAQAEIALTFLDDPSPITQYARGLIHGASVPTVEITTEAARIVERGIPAEFQPVVINPAKLGLDGLCQVDQQISLTEEDFLELPDQAKVETYFRVLVDIGSNLGRYSDVDYERVVSVVMGDQYTVGQAGAVGPGSHAHDITFAQTWNQVSTTGDTAVLAEELAQLRQHLRAEASDPEHDVAIAALAEAEIEAKEGNGPAALERLSRLKRLKGAGKWALNAATVIGTTVAAAALKAVLGL